MRYAHQVRKVRAAEQALMAQLPPGALMQRAAAGLASVSAGLVGKVPGSRVVVLTGSGDNGGDALFAGARLASRGAVVLAVTAGSRVHEQGAAALRDAGGRLAGADDDAVPAAIGAADLILDGLLGIGGRGGLREPQASLAGLAALSPAVVVAVDLPSGVDADTGMVEGPAIQADVTVTFGTLKPGLLIDPGAGHAGVVELIDIGLGPYLDAPDASALQAPDVGALLPQPGGDSDKYRRGVAGIVAGSERFTGAAALAVGGAIRGGAGMVRLVSAAPAVAVVRLLWPEAVITVTGQDIPAGEDVRAAGRVQAWVVGPGMGTDDQARERLAAVLASDVPVLVDADGLTLLAAHKGLLSRDAPTLLTPHAGELGRLLGVDPADVESHRLEHARKAAASLRATVLLKGSTTVIATPDGRSAASQGGAGQGGAGQGGASPGGAGQGGTGQGEAGQDGVNRDGLPPVRVNSTGTSWLATAGTGDVLSGLAGSLLAQGLEVGEAAAAAAYLHGLAARLAAAGAGARPAPAVEPSSGGWDITNPEDPRAGYAEAPIGAADVVGALPDAIRSVRRRAR
ncbi:MAG TPA: NAD(P)H-hydrate epimerase [Streptosporangiaceae bacterium]|nr:NAD(P)H-hydrate epimerase [Streptosporangiaceae bacterium]